jgi:imidazolonepropionase-like amidohydrolase
MKSYIHITILMLTAFAVAAQVPTPAAPQLLPTYIVGATAHLGDGRVLENSIIAFEEGKLTLVRTPETLPQVNLSRYRIIDAKGKHIYPGFIAPNSQIGLVEIGSVRATRDNREVGDMNPSVRSIIAYDTDSEVTPTIRSMGVLLAQIAPGGGRISGQSSIVQLDAWNWEDALYKADDGIFLDWPALTQYIFRERRFQKRETYDADVRDVRKFFDEAYAYSRMEKPDPLNLKFEAMRELFAGKKNLYIRANEVKAVTHAVMFAKEYGLKPVIVGGRDAWMVASLLKENGVPVILGETHSLPAQTFEDVDQPFKTPAMLREAGVLFCFSMDGIWQTRNLSFQAGHAVGYGLPYEDAVSALSLNTAKILGIDATTGSLEEGKDATLFISEGDALDMRTSHVVQAFIKGREIDLDNKQKGLYRKFKEKYEQGR